MTKSLRIFFGGQFWIFVGFLDFSFIIKDLVFGFGHAQLTLKLINISNLVYFASLTNKQDYLNDKNVVFLAQIAYQVSKHDTEC